MAASASVASNVEYDEIKIDGINDNDSELKDEEVKKLREDELRDLAVNASNEYSKYLSVDTSVEEKCLEDAIEDMLTHLDEFCGLLGTIRTGNNACLEQILKKVHAKSEFVEVIYAKIDRLGEFVDVVKKNVDVMEEEVNKAENIFGDGNKVKKFLASIIPSKKSSVSSGRRRVKYEPPHIFSTQKLIRQVNGEEDEEQQAEDLKKEEGKIDGEVVSSDIQMIEENKQVPEMSEIKADSSQA